MKTVDDIRRAKLAELAEEFGTAAALAGRIGCSPAQISQWLNAAKDSRTGKPRGMRKESARLIEQKVGRPTGWLDGLTEAPEPSPGSDSSDRLYTEDDDERALLLRFRQLRKSGGARLRVLAALADEIEVQGARAKKKRVSDDVPLEDMIDPAAAAAAAHQEAAPQVGRRGVDKGPPPGMKDRRGVKQQAGA